MIKSPLVKTLSLLIMIYAALFVSCGEKPTGNYVTLSGFALGTTYHFVVNLPDTTGLQRSVDTLFAEVTSSMSIYDRNSLINRLNRNETDSVDRHIAYCIETANSVSKLSEGEYDITLKPVVDAWGFNAEQPQNKPNVDSLMEFVGYTKIDIINGRLIKDDPRTQIDLNSIAKGYTVDLLAELIDLRGGNDYLIEVGGEIVCKGYNKNGREWWIAIDKPSDGNNIPGALRQATIAMENGALATSGNYRKFYMDDQGRKIVHTISGTTGMSKAGDLLSASVIAGNCTLADAYCTMLMAIGIERAKEFLSKHEEIEGYLVYTDSNGRYLTYVSAGMERKIIK